MAFGPILFSLKLTKLAKLSLRSKLTTIETRAEKEVKSIARTNVVNFVNFDNFERSDNFRKWNLTLKTYEEKWFLGGGASHCDSSTDGGADRTGHSQLHVKMRNEE